MTRALGLIEVMGLPGAIEAADAALKAANVTLLNVAKVGSGIMTVEITGDVGAVTAAVEAAAEAASRITTLRAKHVIPRMDDTLIQTIVPWKQQVQKNKTEDASSSKEVTLGSQPEEETNEAKETIVAVTEDLSKLSNTQLREKILEQGISLPEEELKRLKKQELVNVLERHLKEIKEKGE